jgi:hypothetical protein
VLEHVVDLFDRNALAWDCAVRMSNGVARRARRSTVRVIDGGANDAVAALADNLQDGIARGLAVFGEKRSGVCGHLEA